MVTSSNSNHDSQNMNTVTVNEHQTSITTKRITASNKVSYKDLDDKSISKMMSIDDADAIEKAERAKKSGVDTDMQQRIALARANSGYIALPEKQTNRRTKRARGVSQSCDGTMFNCSSPIGAYEKDNPELGQSRI